jgi:hypothetical protein
MTSKEKDNKVTIKIPRPLYNYINLIKENLGFNSVTDFIVYVLRNLVSTSRTKDTKDSE